MTNRNKPENFYPSYNIRVKTPDGTMFVLIREDHKGNPEDITIHAGKCGTSFAAWATVTANLVKALWQAGYHTSYIVQFLTSPYTPKYTTNENGVKINSGPQGVQQALIEYLNMKREEIQLYVAS